MRRGWGGTPAGERPHPTPVNDDVSHRRNPSHHRCPLGMSPSSTGAALRRCTVRRDMPRVSATYSNGAATSTRPAGWRKTRQCPGHYSRGINATITGPPTTSSGWRISTHSAVSSGQQPASTRPSIVAFTTDPT